MMRTQMNGEPLDDGLHLTPTRFNVAPPIEEPSLKQDFLARLTSRKFLVWFGTVLGLISQLVLGTIDGPAFVTALVAAAGLYQGAEGLADNGNRQ